MSSSTIGIALVQVEFIGATALAVEYKGLYSIYNQAQWRFTDLTNGRGESTRCWWWVLF